MARLEALRGYRVLDTPPEQTFDDLARLTSYICGTPIAFIGFMYSDRLWLKSQVGWDASEISREASFCGHTLLQSDVLVVADTHADHGRLATCSLATERGIRFYAGASLVSPDGYVLGTLAAMDTIPRGLTPSQIDALRKLARQVVALLEARRLAINTIPGTGSPQPAHEPTVDGGKVLGFSFGGPAAILIVEDETILRRLLCLALQKRQHVVYAAKDGLEALDVFREHDREIQLIITDLMMPHMDGIELKNRISALRADVKFLFMSGYAEQVLEQHPGALEGSAFLEKPFLPEELANKVGEMLVPDAAAGEAASAH